MLLAFSIPIDGYMITKAEELLPEEQRERLAQHQVWNLGT